ncbi:MAG: hypothetical protein E6K04_04520 [Methanobacteriota archaeon]|nr:MAG: hypothetical protein E6K04_04520 [Euryarchaeota archaeon]
MSRRLPISPLAVTFFVLLLGAALLPLLSTPAAALGERVYESNTVIAGTNHLSVDSSDSVAQSFLTSASYRLLNLTLRLRGHLPLPTEPRGRRAVLDRGDFFYFHRESV